jgi:hypothetical protein
MATFDDLEANLQEFSTDGARLMKSVVESLVA